MKKTFFKNLFRDIKKTLSRFLSIVIIIAVGVSFYAGVRATSPDMKKSGDVYFNDYNLMEYKLISTLGLTEEDVKEISNLDGVEEAKGSYSLDAVVQENEKSVVLNINSLPDEDGINKLSLVDGRMPKNSNEAIVEAKFLKEYKLNIGDTIELQSGTDKNIGDNLNNNKFTIVGTANSPLYISEQRQLSAIGNGNVRGFVYILSEVFKSEVYTEIYLKTNNEYSKDSLLNNDEYKSSIKELEDKIKELGQERGMVRHDDILNTANQKIKEAEDKLNLGKKEAQDKFAEAHKALDEGRDKITKGEEELTKNEILYKNKIADGKKQLQDGKKQLQSGEAQLNEQAKKIQDGKVQLAQGKKALVDNETKLNAGKQLAVSEINKALSENEQLKEFYENKIKGKDFDSIYDALKEKGLLAVFDPEEKMVKMKGSEQELNAGKIKLAATEKTLNSGESSINAGREEVAKNRAKLVQGEINFEKGRVEGANKLAEGKTTLENGKKELEDNTNKLKEEEEKVNKQLADGEAELNSNKEKLKDIKNAEIYLLGRSANVGYETYRQDSDRIDNIGKAFPLVFFLVAALVSLTTMTRMVQENRIEIGTFKALGYSRAAIVSHYLIYSLTASLIGSLIGISFGFKLFPPLIMNAYSTLYTIPNKIAFFNTSIALQASLVAIFFTTIAAVGASFGELREVPASLLRPKPPKAGKKIFLEYIPFIWKNLKFTRKVTARNIFRYKQRFFMTVIGIGACTGLMVTGFGLKDGITGATEKQFNQIYKYNMTISLKDSVSYDEKESIKEKVIKDVNINSVLFYYSKNSSAEKPNSSSEDVYLVVPEDKNKLNDYIDLAYKDKTLTLSDDGVILTQKFAKLIDKKVGDTFNLTIDNKIYEVKISAITEHYIQHFIYMSPAYYRNIIGEEPVVNNFYGVLNDTAEDNEEATSKTLKEVDKVNSISFKSSVHGDFGKTMDSINSVVLILIISAGVLAFVVIYNLTNININERRRELATIKLLGFYNKELASYIYRENMILTVIGSIVGIFIGIFIDNFVVSTAETNIMMFMRSIGYQYFIFSIILTIVFSLIVNLAMYNRFDKIDMIESLKSAE
ncbi:FtsX-like permease family protein [Clostridium sp. SHJSY1]|uniref:FtsX-like permease family protein n=1 Tax=Clostridium sp. SHJSY1 TaxID=2942483 RepID=UPI0028763265|nr:FtsX-like permease family protein [Clostridium sp. SHJSY1]MDS0524850.1 FtsX-like permease family protein [Clostridium sp. SHJSY1]